MSAGDAVMLVIRPFGVWPNRINQRIEMFDSSFCC